VRDHNKQTGNERKTWHFYEAMNPVMADKPTSNPPVMIDTLLESQDNTADESDETWVEKDECEKTKECVCKSEESKRNKSDAQRNDKVKQDGKEAKKNL